MSEYYFPRKTGEEMLALKEELLSDKKRILDAYPELAREYTERTAYSKYSKNNNLSLLIPSAVIDRNNATPKLIDKLPKNKDVSFYREYVYDVDGNILITSLVDKEKFKNEIFYIVDFKGYKYLINNIDEITENNKIVRLKFVNGKPICREEYVS